MNASLAVAVLVHLYHAGQDADTAEAPRTAMPTPARDVPPPTDEDEDRFEFYEILPEFEVPVPEPPQTHLWPAPATKSAP